VEIRRTIGSTALAPLASVLLFTLVLVGCGGPQTTSLDLRWQDVTDRPWPGPHLWANRLQDWEVRDGKLLAVNSLPMRTAHLLTRRSTPQAGEILVTLRMGFTNVGVAESEAQRPTEALSAGGFLLGAGGAELDYRRVALIHHSPGSGGGLFLGVDELGRLLAVDFSDEFRTLTRSEVALPATDSLELTIRVGGGRGDNEVSQEEEGFTLALAARPLGGRDPPLTLELPGIAGHRLTGGMALVSHSAVEAGPRTWFSSARVSGSGVEAYPDRRLGPILGAQHILSRDALTLTAQLLPISPLAPGPETASGDTVLLEVQDESGLWVSAASAPVVVPGYTATFRLDAWPGFRPVPYRLTLMGEGAERRGDSYGGTVRAEPGGQEELVVAAFTGNHNVASPGVDRGSFDWERHLWFPHEDIVKHVQAHAPDFLFFSGDQVYEGASPTRADFGHPYGDYLYKWYLWLWAFRDLTADIPSVAIPDDHDVFHGNVWGAGGIATPPGLTGADAQDQGGYRLPPDWVNMVQRTQTSHLPSPWDSTPSDQGIEVYFTDILYGGVSFAVLEDRKFKSPPKLLLPEASVRNGWAQAPGFNAQADADPPGASLLGMRQEEFLEEWAADWTDGTWMKVALSQTIFGNVATIPADAMSGSVIPTLPIPEPGAYVTGDKVAADMDSNGWPPSGRDRALRAMRQGFAVHLAGDQHLASTIQYGVDGYGDGPFALCVPSVANFWPRRWYPPDTGGNRAQDAPLYTGDFLDGFGNPMTVFAVSNPVRWERDPATLHDRAPGYGIARLNRSTREVSLEAWPRWSDPAAGGTPYPGWPVRFQQEDGYGQDPFGYLPTLVVEGLTDPVVQVISELGGEIVYTVRIRGSRFTPKIFEPGTYTVRIGEPGTGSMRSFLGLQATPDSSRTLEIRFDGLI
jgi:alkaline phosphatase D